MNSVSIKSYGSLAVILAGILLLLIVSIPCFAQDISEPPVPAEVLLSHSGVVPGGTINLAVVLEIPADHHATDVKNGLFYLDVQVPDGITVKDTLWPGNGIVEKDEEVYRGQTSIQLVLAVSSSMSSGSYELPYSYSYQICRDIQPETCFMPNGGDGTVTLHVLEPGSTPMLNGHTVFASLSGVSEKMGTEKIPANLEDRLTQALERGSLLAFILVFLAGILVSFTPCVYPMIPIIIGFVGAGAGGSKAKGFVLSIFFVIGLAIMYASLGVVAGATGALFGGLMQNPVVMWGIVGIFIALGASMLGAFDIALPASVQGKLMSGQRQGLIGAVIMGAVTGIVAAPCAGPPLLVLLGWIGKTGNLVLGFFLMAVFALGIGVLFIVIGTFAGAMTAMPQAGPWMDKIKKGLGILIFAVALYYLNMLVAPGIFTLILGTFLLIVGLFFGAMAAWENLSTGGKYFKGLGMVLLLAGAFYILLGLARHHELPIVQAGALVSGGPAAIEEVDENHVAWRVNDYEAVMADASSQGLPILIDFYADWCGVCVELDHKVWNQDNVISASEQYIALKLDFTRSTQELEALRKNYNVGGLPTVIILGPDGVERSRFSSFKEPSEVVVWLNQNV